MGAENQYASVLGQVGGKYIGVTAIMSNPNTDPHTFEASPSVVQLVSSARLVIQNGLGYDTFMNRIEAASPNPKRRVIDVQTLLGLPDSTSNPHLWYRPSTMPAVAKAAAADLSALEPAHASFFQANAATFDASLKPWYQAIMKVKVEFPAAPVATSEPVCDYLLQSAGTYNLTPWPLQADIMNGVDPSPEDVSIQQSLFTQHRVRVFVYNQQVTDSLTQAFLSDAKQAGIPVVGVYETMPAPGYDYQSWMLAETHAIYNAFKYKTSTQRL
ncbi:MAG TPA: zinc ABC transporter substrate-binding protein [Candidatus Dormibacteraeota bacterium]|nr:zinc ABC transporter substrate-binding protein [Candidatus Dormibacteraeota bacterium]